MVRGAPIYLSCTAAQLRSAAAEAAARRLRAYRGLAETRRRCRVRRQFGGEGELGEKKLMRYCIKRKRISGISRISFYHVFSSRISFYPSFFENIEYQRVNFEIPRNFHQIRCEKR